jgi:hypothetical protein
MSVANGGGGAVGGGGGGAVGGGGTVGSGSWPAVGEAAHGEEDIILVGKRGGGARGGGCRSAGRQWTTARRWSTREGAAPQRKTAAVHGEKGRGPRGRRRGARGGRTGTPGGRRGGRRGDGSRGRRRRSVGKSGSLTVSFRFAPDLENFRERVSCIYRWNHHWRAT